MGKTINEIAVVLLKNALGVGVKYRPHFYSNLPGNGFLIGKTACETTRVKMSVLLVLGKKGSIYYSTKGVF